MDSTRREQILESNLPMTSKISGCEPRIVSGWAAIVDNFACKSGDSNLSNRNMGTPTELRHFARQRTCNRNDGDLSQKSLVSYTVQGP